MERVEVGFCLNCVGNSKDTPGKVLMIYESDTLSEQPLPNIAEL
jgi:hypothetical protein